MSSYVNGSFFAILYLSIGVHSHAQTLKQESFFQSSVLTNVQLGSDDLYVSEVNYHSSDNIKIIKLPDDIIMSFDSILVRDIAYDNEMNFLAFLLKDYNNQFYLYSKGVGKSPVRQKILDYGVFNTLSYATDKGVDIIFGFRDESLYWYAGNEGVVQSLAIGEEICGVEFVNGAFFLCSFDSENLNVYGIQREGMKKQKLHSVSINTDIEDLSVYSNGEQFIFWYSPKPMSGRTNILVLDEGAVKKIEVEGEVHNIVLRKERLYFNISYFISDNHSLNITESGSVDTYQVCNIFSADVDLLVDGSKWLLPD